MNILALNGGSATVKAAWFARRDGALLRDGHWNVARAGDDAGLGQLASQLPAAPQRVVHRIVHGGDRFAAATVLDDAVLATLREFVPLAPLHQPFNLDIVAAARHQWPQALHVGCFDTAFHQTQTDLQRRYALPRALHERGIKRYGFHGLSYAHVSQALYAQEPALRQGKVVIAHLGSGASACAVQGGRSVASSMGFSPLDGLVMSTRCGQLDPGVLLYLPLKAPMRTRGVLALAAPRRSLFLNPDSRRQIEAYATLIAIALERLHYVEVAQQALVSMESEKLRNSLLAAVSHDLRTPLTSLVGMTDTLMRQQATLPPDIHDTVRAMRDQAQRMHALVVNLLDMARLQNRDTPLRLEWQSIEELVGASLAAMREPLAAHRVTVDS